MAPRRPATPAVVTNGDVIAMPSWFIKLIVSVLLGAILSTLAWATGLNATTARNEARVDIMAEQLNRIESKLDALLINKLPTER